jgi:hypothetical protein
MVRVGKKFERSHTIFIRSAVKGELKTQDGKGGCQ